MHCVYYEVVTVIVLWVNENVKILKIISRKRFVSGKSACADTNLIAVTTVSKYQTYIMFLLEV